MLMRHMNVIDLQVESRGYNEWFFSSSVPLALIALIQDNYAYYFLTLKHGGHRTYSFLDYTFDDICVFRGSIILLPSVQTGIRIVRYIHFPHRIMHIKALFNIYLHRHLTHSQEFLHSRELALYVLIVLVILFRKVALRPEVVVNFRY